MGNFYSIIKKIQRGKNVFALEYPKKVNLSKAQEDQVLNKLGKRIEPVKILNEMQAGLHSVCDKVLEVVALHQKFEKTMKNRQREEILREGRYLPRPSHKELHNAMMEIIRSVLELKMLVWRYYANLEHL